VRQKTFSDLYNNQQPQQRISYFSPLFVHESNIQVIREWKSYNSKQKQLIWNKNNIFYKLTIKIKL